MVDKYKYLERVLSCLRGVCVETHG